MSYMITDPCIGCGACVRVCPADAIAGEKKSLHVIDAGRCIECGACGRVCPADCILDATGGPCARVKRSEWPRPAFDLMRCLACICCIEACPAGSLGFTGPGASSGPHNYPCLENEKTCIGCGFCVQACPVDAVTLQTVPPTLPSS